MPIYFVASIIRTVVFSNLINTKERHGLYATSIYYVTARSSEETLVTLLRSFSAGALEYIDCISAEDLDSSNECSKYDTKQSDGEVPVLPELWEMRNTPLL